MKEKGRGQMKQQKSGGRKDAAKTKPKDKTKGKK